LTFANVPVRGLNDGGAFSRVRDAWQSRMQRDLTAAGPTAYEHPRAVLAMTLGPHRIEGLLKAAVDRPHAADQPTLLRRERGDDRELSQRLARERLLSPGPPTRCGVRLPRLPRDDRPRDEADRCPTCTTGWRRVATMGPR
jgi:hypothetical protein